MHSTVWLQGKAADEALFLVITLQIGFMNNGEIKAADVEYYVNGGCTPDESEMVNTPSGKPMVLTLSAQILVLQLTNSEKEFKLKIKFKSVA